MPSTVIIFLLCVLSLTAQRAQGLTLASDVAALKAFKAAIDPASIAPWSCLASWDFAAADPCAIPRRDHFICGVACTAAAAAAPPRVAQITLDPAAYSGTLTPLLSRLSRLAVLDIADNSFRGQIPASLAALTGLQSLTLRANNLSGPVPASLTALKSLETLDLSRNALSGPLPSSLSSMPALTRLDLSYNNLTGSLPKLPPNLLELAMKGNSLSGSINKASFAGLARLEVVELSENAFSGTLGSWFFQLPSVQQVNLANNSLTGVEIPSPARSGSDLVAVDLGFNRIEGQAPAKFADFPILSSLSLRYNRLRGQIPLEYGKKKSLRRLYLDGNFLTGQPPAGFFAGESDVYGSLGDNCLRGCPSSSRLCLPSQKPTAICKQAYGGGRGKPRSP